MVHHWLIMDINWYSIKLISEADLKTQQNQNLAKNYIPMFISCMFRLVLLVNVARWGLCGFNIKTCLTLN